MRQFCLAVLFSSAIFAAPSTHLIHPSKPLTRPASGAPRAIADAFVRGQQRSLGLSSEAVSGLYVAKEYRTSHNGVTHIVYRQRFSGLDVYNAEWVVNLDRDGQVLNAGGQLYNPPSAPVPTAMTARAALSSAVRAVNPKLGARLKASEKTATRFSVDGLSEDVDGEAVWYAVGNTLQPAWLFAIVDQDGVGSYNVVVHSDNRRVLQKDELTFYQTAKGQVFAGQSPEPNPNSGVLLTGTPQFVDRTSVSFAGDPAASPAGWSSNGQTIGNNAVVGANPLGTRFILSPQVATSTNGDFSFPLQLGPGKPGPASYADAASTNLFYWVNRAHDLHYASGFDEAAGNYQQDNFGKGGIGGDPLYAYSQFSSAGASLAALNNAFYTTRRSGVDGQQSMIAMYVGDPGNGVFTDGSYDSEVIIHEYTHGVSTRLVRQLRSFQGGAMGEAWSDFFGLEYTVPEGAPIDGAYPQGEYLFQTFGTGIRTRPYTTDMSINPLTYGSLGAVRFSPEVHADGEIWATTLWELRAALIKQLGETEGRRRVRMIVLDGMKLSVPDPTMLQMRDAILLAERVDFKGESQSQLWAAFAKRGMGVLAQSADANSVHVRESFDTPSNTGSVGFYEKFYVTGEAIRVVLFDGNYDQPTATVILTSTSGDRETVTLQRSGMVYTGLVPTTTAVVSQESGSLTTIPGDTVTIGYADDNADGAPKVVSASIAMSPTYFVSLGGRDFTFGKETAQRINTASGITSFRQNLPFEFPFFGQKYTSILVYGSGLLAFNRPLTPGCQDAAGLAAYSGIAPLWMEASVAGVTQANEDVYVSRPDDDTIVFHWVGETDSPYTLDGHTLNFAAVLHRDGRIEFKYGPNNTSLAAPSAYSGCGASTPVVGLSPGDQTYTYTYVPYTGEANLENATGLQFQPPFGANSPTTGTLETDIAGKSFQTSMTVKGYIQSAVDLPRAVYVLVDGIYRAAPASESRADVCSTLGVTPCSQVRGFTYVAGFDALGLAPGEHTIQFRGVNARGSVVNFPDQPVTFTVASGQTGIPTGAIESPAAGATVSGTATIRGYAYADGARVSSVDVLVDGLTYGRALYGLTRADICAGVSNAPNCPAAGFQFSLNTVSGSLSIANGPHSLQVRVTDEFGRLTLIPAAPVAFTVNNASRSTPVGMVTSPSNGDKISGTLNVSGYAYDPSGGRITGYSVIIDSYGYSFSGTTGTPRPDVCAGLPNVKACPGIGFDFTINSKILPNGPHSLLVRVTNDQGVTTTLDPHVIGGGINIIVQNQ